MNGNWFPWSGYFYGGGKELSKDVYAGPELYKKAYRYVVDRVRAMGAKNIIWETIPRRAMGLRLRFNDLCLRRSLRAQPR